MAKHLELRNPIEARRVLLHGLRLQRAGLPGVDVHRLALRWSLEMASEGYPLPPAGIVGDLAVLGLHSGRMHLDAESVDPAWCLPNALRRYEDYVLARFLADSSFRRGADATMRYQGRERRQAFAYILHRIIERTGVGGVMLSPSVIRQLVDDEKLSQHMAGADDAEEFGRLIDRYVELTSAVQRTGNILSAADILEVERGIAVSGFGQRLAFRHVIEAAEYLDQALPRIPPRSTSRAAEVATALTHFDAYPVGGFGSLTCHGTLESLLNSQLAFMEDGQRPDLFDIKYLRGELLYYSRDENQFLRRRYRYSFLLSSDLSAARIKQSLPWQRIIVLLALCERLVRRLIDWLSTESLHFEFVVLDRAEALADEEALLQLLFSDLISSGTISICRRSADEWLATREENKAQAIWRSLAIDCGVPSFEAADGTMQRLDCRTDVPQIDGVDAAEVPAETGAAWQAATRQLLERWM